MDVANPLEGASAQTSTSPLSIVSTPPGEGTGSPASAPTPLRGDASSFGPNSALPPSPNTTPNAPQVKAPSDPFTTNWTALIQASDILQTLATPPSGQASPPASAAEGTGQPGGNGTGATTAGPTASPSAAPGTPQAPTGPAQANGAQGTAGPTYPPPNPGPSGSGGGGNLPLHWDQPPGPPPTVLNPGSQTTAEGASVTLPLGSGSSNLANYEAVDLPPGLNIDHATGIVSGTVSYRAAEGFGPQYNVTVVGGDNFGNSSTQTFTWTIVDTVRPPVLSNPGNQSNAGGDTVSVQLSATQPDGDAVNYNAVGLPTGLKLDADSGLITGTIDPSATLPTAYSVTLTATDRDQTTSQSITWNVARTNHAPTVTPPRDQSNSAGDAVSLAVAANDIDGNTLTYAATGLPSGLSIDPATGVIAGTVAGTAASTTPYAVTVNVADGTTTTTQAFNWSVNGITLAYPPDQTNTDGDTVSLSAAGTDAAGLPLTYSASGLPTGLSIASATGIITGTIAAGASNSGSYDAVVTAADGVYSRTVFFTWTVLHAHDTAPILTAPASQTNTAGDAVSLALTATDADNDTLTYSTTGLPDGLTLDTSTGVISGTLLNDAVSTTPYQLTVAVDDGNGGTSSQTFSWLVNAGTVTTQAPPITATEGVAYSGMLATFADSDLTAQAGNFSAFIDWGDGTSEDGTISVIDATTFGVPGGHTYAHPGSYSATVMIGDSTAGTSTTVTSAVSVAEVPLTVTGGLINDVLPGPSGIITVASFTDANRNQDAGSYHVSVDPGPAGSSTDVGVQGNNGVFTAACGVTYSLPGVYTLTVTVTDSDGTTAQASSTVVVGNLVTCLRADLTGYAFNAPGSSSDYHALVNWGDGTPLDASATISGGGGSFGVFAHHTYLTDGSTTAQVTVLDAGGNTVAAGSSTVSVVPAALTLYKSDLAAQPGVPLTDVGVAYFTDPNYTDVAGQFTATVNWGDGTGTGASVVGSNGVFRVQSSHTFTSAAYSSITVDVYEGTKQVLRTISDAFPQAGSVTLERVRFKGGYMLYRDKLKIQAPTNASLDKVVPYTIDVQLGAKPDPTRDLTGLSGVQWVRDDKESAPYAFTRNTPFNASAIFKIQNPQYTGDKLNVKAFLFDANRNVQLGTAEGTATLNKQAGTYSIQDFTTKPNLPDEVTYYDHLQMAWTTQQVTAPGEPAAPWVYAGTSDNLVYLLDKTPDATVVKKGLMQTLVDLSCRAVADGGKAIPAATDDKVVLDAIWQNFSQQKAKRTDGSAMQYYGKWATANFGDLGYRRLISELDGQCSAWVGLFEAEMFVQGLHKSTSITNFHSVTIKSSHKPDPKMESPQSAKFSEALFGGFLIKNWTFTANVPPNSPELAAYPFANLDIPLGENNTPIRFKENAYDFGKNINNIEVKYNKGLPGQNNPTPVGSFNNHTLSAITFATTDATGKVVETLQLYDPSYGQVYKTGKLKEFQDAAVDGFYKIVPRIAGNIRDMLIRQIDVQTPVQLVEVKLPPIIRPGG